MLYDVAKIPCIIFCLLYFGFKVSQHERRPSQLEALNEMPLYPTEEVIWDENLVPTEYNASDSRRGVTGGYDFSSSSGIFNVYSVNNVCMRIYASNGWCVCDQLLANITLEPKSLARIYRECHVEYGNDSIHDMILACNVME